MHQPIKLNLGCGLKHIPGFINIDLRAETKPDVCMDISKISTMFKDVDLIFASHVLEHFPNKPSSTMKVTWRDVLADWYKALKNRSVLYLSVPDFEATCKHYLNIINCCGSDLKASPLKKLYGLLYGGQKNDFDYHYHAWDFETLSNDLKDVGFTTVTRYDWREMEWKHIDSYEQAYLPHMDKVYGRLMSVNVRAQKWEL